MKIDQPKILYVHGGGDTIGGVETFLARSLTAHQQYCPYLAIVREGKFSDYLFGYPRVVHLGGGRIRQVRRTFHAIRRGVQLVHDEMIRLLIAKGTHSWFFGGCIAKLARIPSMFYLAGDVKPEHFRQPLDSIALRIHPNLYVANSEFTAGSVRRYLKGKVEVVSPYPDLREFDVVDDEYARKAIRSEFNIPSGSFMFLMPARIQKWKGQDTVIRAFQKMRQKSKAVLMIVGECTFASDEPYYMQLKQLAEKDRSILFAGFRRDIPALMKAADAIVHASRNPEPFGIVIAEGMMAGKPVIATEHGGPIEMIRHGVNGLLYAPEDFDQLAILMDNLIEQPVLRNKISEAALIAARQRLNLECSVMKIEELISEILLPQRTKAQL